MYLFAYFLKNRLISLMQYYPLFAHSLDGSSTAQITLSLRILPALKVYCTKNLFARIQM